MRDPWTALAERWHEIEAPLRPSVVDVQIVERAAARGRATSVLVLGVTPELVNASYPAGCDVVAVDSNAAMISKVWPGRGRCLLGDWTAMPLEDGAVDLVVGDGVLSTTDQAAAHKVLLEVRRVLTQKGRLVLRCFALPAVRETVENILDSRDSPCRKKLRLWAALHGDSGVRLGDVYDACAGYVDGAGVGAYRDSDARYHLDTPDGYQRRFRAAGFRIVGAHDDDRCPVFVLQPAPLPVLV